MLKHISEALQPTTSNVPKPPTPTTTSSSPNVPTPTISDIKARVDKAVSESGDLITALEHVGAMYGIPSTSIIADPNAKGIRIENDNIIAPPIEANKKQTTVIVQAVGSVLDYISQRIDDKLNDYQMNNINQGRIEDSIKMHANPRKGNVIGRYEDDNGDEILAYDTGLVDMANTDAARAKVDELRSTNTIPTFDPGAGMKSAGDEYFNDEDDVTADVDMDASSDTPAGMEVTEEHSIAKQIQESAYHVHMYAKMGDTTHLGYDLLQKHGFDFVKPVDSIVMESKTEEEKPSKKSKVHTSDIKYMKFDNTGILKAVDYFNEARDNQENAKQMNLDEFFNDPSFEKGIDSLNKQFNCRINLRMIKTKPGKYENVGTPIYANELKKKLTISKSKGFQLGGLPIDIIVYNHYFENASPNDTKLFGQRMVSIICHEIFHNISSVLRRNNAVAGMSLTMTLDIAAAAKTPMEKRKIITNYVDTLDEMSNNKLINKIAKKKLIKQLSALTVVEHNSKAMSNVNDNDEYIDDIIKKYKKAIKKYNYGGKSKYIFPAVITAGSILGAIFGPGNMALSIGIGGVCAGLSIGASMAAIDFELIEMTKKYSNSKLYEEYYCDLFASMYKLPMFFFIGIKSKDKRTANEFSEGKLAELAKLETTLSKAVYSSYPSDMERTYAGVKVAKELLKEKDLEPQLKKYCQWIVDNFSKVEKINIDTIYNKATFNPKEAENLDKHLEDLIGDNNIALTESFKMWINSNDEII